MLHAPDYDLTGIMHGLVCHWQQNAKMRTLACMHCGIHAGCSSNITKALSSAGLQVYAITLSFMCHLVVNKAHVRLASQRAVGGWDKHQQAQLISWRMQSAAGMLSAHLVPLSGHMYALWVDVKLASDPTCLQEGDGPVRLYVSHRALVQQATAHVPHIPCAHTVIDLQSMHMRLLAAQPCRRTA